MSVWRATLGVLFVLIVFISIAGTAMAEFITSEQNVPLKPSEELTKEEL